MPVPNFFPGEVLTAAAMDAVGMWHITTVSPTPSTVVAVSSCFSADYTNYRIICTPIGPASAGDIRVKLRSGATPSSTEYYMTNIFASGGSISSNSENNQSSFRGVYNGGTSTTLGSLSFDLYGPFLSVATRYEMQSSGYDGSVINRSATGFHFLGNSYNGFELSAGSNITATISVYGYNKGS